MLTAVAIGLTGLVVFAYIAQWAISRFDDAREPPRLDPKFPLVGHLYGMLRGGSDYYTSTSKRTNAEIYTLGIFHYKIYIVGTHRLTSAVQKCSKTLSFRPFVLTAVRRWANGSDEVVAMFGRELEGMGHVVRTALAPGPELDAQNMRMGTRVLSDIDQLMAEGKEGPPEFQLHAWTKEVVVQASSCGIFGLQHPFGDPKVVAAFWAWQKYLIQQTAGVDFTGKGTAPRAVVMDSCRRYTENMPADASAVIRERYDYLDRLGMSTKDIGEQLVTFTVAALANTVPTMYWTIHELFPRPELLASVREEIVAHAVSGDREKGFTFDVAALKTKCPLILSVFQEMQRTRHIHALIRKVTDDTLLDGKYLLKKGNYLQMPGQPINNERSSWGDSVDEFNPYRFVPGGGGVDDTARKGIAPSTFVPWGSAPHLCPARQFAATEILIAVALLVVRADIVPMQGSWELRPALETSELLVIHGPKKDIGVQARRREEYAGTWSLKMGESKTRVSLASG